jgi:uncharacterized protein (TIGR03083 family)
VDLDTIWQHIDSERAWMADTLEGLSPEQWDRPSLCVGWTVRDVGAHLSMAQAGIGELVGPMLRKGFRYDATIKYAAVRNPRTHEEIVATIRGFLGSRRKAPMITDLEPLIDVLVHNQDIAVPLGLEHAMPPAAAAAAADRVLSTPWPLRRWKASSGVRLVATDTDWSWGSGQVVESTMQEHLLLLTGRTKLPSRA